MPWKASSVMEEKLRFILEYEAGEESMTELCQRYDISRETGYLTLRRYRMAGASRTVAAEPCGAPAWQPDAGGDRTEGAGAAAGTHALGATKAETRSGA